MTKIWREYANRVIRRLLHESAEKVSSQNENSNLQDQLFEDRWFEDRWNSVPDEMKERIVAHLRKLDNLQEHKEALDNDPFYHMWGGTAIRNYLREIIRDDELPPAPYPEFKSEFRNWDDYYSQAIRAAAE
jgi:hypothetical protein